MRTGRLIRLTNLNDISCGHVRKCVILLDHIFIRLGSKLYRRIVGIPMGAKSAPLVADLVLQMRKTLCCVCQTIIKLILLEILTPTPDIMMTYLILIILILTK